MHDTEYFQQDQDKGVKRACPICERQLEIEDFAKTYEKPNFELWENKEVAIPCCNCFKIMRDFAQTDCVEIDYPTDLTRAWRIVNNLYKMGFITESKRDKTFKDYRERLTIFKQRNFFRYTLS